LKQLSIEQLMNLEVTSVSKRPERLSQTASAIQVITAEDIRRSGAASLAEALRLATNLQVAQLDSRQWAISARGFNGTAANKLLVLIDGRTVYTPLFSGVFWDVQEVPLADIDRIEVISGPGATLWGSNAVNGVINVITKDAKDTQGLLLAGGGGTEQHGFGTVRYGAALGSTVRARVYGRGFDRDATAFPNGRDAADDWHLGQGGFRMDWEASSASRVTLQGDLYDGRIAQDSGRDIAVSGRNVIAKWSRTLSERSSLAAQLYYRACSRRISTPTTSICNTLPDWARVMMWSGGSGTGTSTIAPRSARTPRWHFCPRTSRGSGLPGLCRTRSRSFPTGCT
jgi:iron complex outermembrane receptor protein